MIVITLASVCLNCFASYVLVAKIRVWRPQARILFSMFIGNALAPSLAYPLTIYANFKEHWTLGSNACVYYAFVTSVGGIASIYHLVLLSAERFITLAYPYDQQRFLSDRNINIALVLTWTLSIVASHLPLVGWSSFALEGIGTSCALDLFPKTWSSKSFIIFLVCIGFVLPMIAIIYFNVSFLGVVFGLIKCPCHSESNVNQHDRICQTSQDRRLANQMSVLVTLMIVCFISTWLPYAIVAVIGIFGKLSRSNPLALSLPAFFAKSYTIYDPLIYFFLNKTFRQAVASMFCPGQAVSNSLGFYSQRLQRPNSGTITQQTLRNQQTAVLEVVDEE